MRPAPITASEAFDLLVEGAWMHGSLRHGRTGKPGEAVLSMSRETRQKLAQLSSADLATVQRDFLLLCCHRPTWWEQAGMTARQLRAYDARLRARMEHWS